MYQVVRYVRGLEAKPEAHVQPHTHVVPTLYSFIGSGNELDGLEADVYIGSGTHRIQSPCAVLVPKGVIHSYRLVSGSGIFVHTVSVGDFNKSVTPPTT